MAKAKKATAPTVASQIDAAVPGLLKEFSVPGAAVAVIENGEVVLMKGYGRTDRTNGIRVNTGTLFNVGSLSKPVTAWGGMLLVQRGKVTLDEPVDRRLTRWHLPTSNFDNDGVTIRRILSHTAGLSVSGYSGRGVNDPSTTLEESLSGTNNGAGALKLIAKPGSTYRYSGGGYTLLQLLIEEVSGEHFDDYMQANVLRPLGMKTASYDQTLALAPDIAQGHDELGEAIPAQIFTESGAAGLYASIKDMTHFAMALIPEPGVVPGRGVLTPETLDLMTSPAPGTGGSTGLGYAVGGDFFPDGKARVWHRGTNFGYQAFLAVGRDSGDGLIILTNGFNGEAVYDQIRTIWMNGKGTFRTRIPKPIIPSLAESLRIGGVAAMEKRYYELKKAPAGEYDFNARGLNTLGLNLLEKGRLQDAVRILELNAREYPQNWNVLDSLGEAYSDAHDVPKAIAAFERSLKLNPDNGNARDRLVGLRKLIMSSVNVQSK